MDVIINLGLYARQILPSQNWPRLYLQYLFLTGIRVDLVLGDSDFWKPIRYIQVESDIFDQGVILLVFNISISRSLECFRGTHEINLTFLYLYGTRSTK